MNIPENPSLGYIAIILFLIGLFLFISGLNILKVEKITVSKGFKTWIIGLLLMIAGVFLGVPDLINDIKEKDHQKVSSEKASSEKKPILSSKINSLNEIKPSKVSKLENSKYEILADGVIDFSNYGNLWTENQSYDVTSSNKVIVKVSVKTNDSGITIAFSENRKDWSSGKSDALTFGTGAGEKAFTAIRTDMYKAFVESTSKILIPNKWQKIEVLLTKYEIVAYIEGRKVIFANLKHIDFPKKGFVGIAQHKGSTLFKDFSVSQYDNQ